MARACDMKAWLRFVLRLGTYLGLTRLLKLILGEQITTTPANFFGQTTTSEERDSMSVSLRERRPTEEDLDNGRL